MKFSEEIQLIEEMVTALVYHKINKINDSLHVDDVYKKLHKMKIKEIIAFIEEKTDYKCDNCSDEFIWRVYLLGQNHGRT